VLLAGYNTPATEHDVLCIAWLIACIGIETLADEQQWVFQNAKRATPSKSTRSHSRQSSLPSYCKSEDLNRGFITGGLWRYSRHPNFACEQAIWFLFYFFGCIATVCRCCLFSCLEIAVELDDSCTAIACDDDLLGMYLACISSADRRVRRSLLNG